MAQIGEAIEAIAAAETERAARRARRPSRFDKKAFYASRAWRALRYRTLAANRGKYGRITCEVCKVTVGPFHADHIVPLSQDWSRRLDPTNVQIQCAACNTGKGNTDAIDWREPAAA